ncbi:hypothetical protein [Actinopolymorpha cephalotaxi]|uniref:Uncharacterized protein n=1 Tax=Actinopolymorpha cephalotaxi TaxID=504797 RepID=A0ABX2SAS0_9ACTN|nr:hypothetical protein [Actinopolymorpha cephalotaxi]NYH86359.1 hypothetical protein [Actinopolymorpha cephalotaxi]
MTRKDRLTGGRLLTCPHLRPVRLLENFTTIRPAGDAGEMTWKLVRMMPLRLRTSPDPVVRPPTATVSTSTTLRRTWAMICGMMFRALPLPGIRGL